MFRGVAFLVVFLTGLVSSQTAPKEKCGPLEGKCNCVGHSQYCNPINGWCGNTFAHYKKGKDSPYSCPNPKQPILPMKKEKPSSLKENQLKVQASSFQEKRALQKKLFPRRSQAHELGSHTSRQSSSTSTSEQTKTPQMHCGPKYGGAKCNCAGYSHFCNEENGYCGISQAHRIKGMQSQYSCKRQMIRANGQSSRLKKFP